MTEKPDFEAEKSLLSSLLETSKLYRHSKEYLELLNFISRLRKFAPFNGFILHLQKPGLRFAASEYEWKKHFGRTLKEGARPLIILWPFSPVALVYDVEDTEGYPLPESALHSFFAEGDFNPLKFLVLKRPITRKGIESLLSHK